MTRRPGRSRVAEPSSHVAPYDLDVVDEAIVNAVAHRDYAVSGSTILQDGEAHAGRRPEYALFGDELRLTLWAKKAAADR